MFGFAYYVQIEGPLVFGRWNHAMKLLKSIGEHKTQLPMVFHEGGHRLAVGGWGMEWRDERVHSVMRLVVLHEGEYRRWHPEWGASGASEGESEEWQYVGQPAVGGLPPTHPLVMHHQLQLTPRTSSDPSSNRHSTLVRKSAGQPFKHGYEARNVFITSLSEVLLPHMGKCTVQQLNGWSVKSSLARGHTGGYQHH